MRFLKETHLLCRIAKKLNDVGNIHKNFGDVNNNFDIKSKLWADLPKLCVFFAFITKFCGIGSDIISHARVGGHPLAR
jgi:hypothetical protein